MNKLLHVKAGKAVYEMIKDGNFHLNQITAYFGAAGGPRWLIASGFDRTLMMSGLLGRTKPLLLVGASSGALRFAAWLLPEAEESYHRLMEVYIARPDTRTDTPRRVQDSLIEIINAYIEDDALPFAIAHPHYRLAIITARAKNLIAAEIKGIQWFGLALCFLGNLLDRNHLFSFLERVVFYTGVKPPLFTLKPDFQGQYVPLKEANFKHALLASAAIPLIVSGVRDIYGAPPGVYRDGGLIDYHISTRYAAGTDEVTLFFHHQERLIPGWLDRKLKRRLPPPEATENLLLVYPTEAFLDSLPGGKVPDRSDFITYSGDPETRKKRWWEAVKKAAPLGEEFLELFFSGKIREEIEPLS